MIHALAAVDFKTGTQSIEAGFLAGKHLPRHRQRVGDGTAQLGNRRQPHALKFHVEKADVEFGIVDNQLGTAQEIGNLPPHFGKRRRIFVFQHRNGEAVHRRRFLGHVALGVHIEVQIVVGEMAVAHFQPGKFHHAVAVVGVETGGFGVENDLALAHDAAFVKFTRIILKAAAKVKNCAVWAGGFRRL